VEGGGLIALNHFCTLCLECVEICPADAIVFEEAGQG
jgi:ferredoxin